MLTIVHHDIRKIANIFLLLGEGPAEYIYDSITEPEKNNKNKILSELTLKVLRIYQHICLTKEVCQRFYKKWNAMGEISLKDTIYDFLVIFQWCEGYTSYSWGGNEK